MADTSPPPHSEDSALRRRNPGGSSSSPSLPGSVPPPLPAAKRGTTVRRVAVLIVALVALYAAFYVFNPTSTRDEPADTAHDALWDSSAGEDGPVRIVGVGDLHGDLPHALKVLRMAGLIDEKGDWAGGRTIFVQTGDIVDRGPDTIELYKMMQRLQEQAPKQGGRPCVRTINKKVIPLLGNHETMNMMEDLRYVTKEDIESFGGMEKRKFAWSREGWLGKYLRELNIVANVNGTVFMHGGMHPKWAAEGIDALNEQARTALLTKSSAELWHVPLFGGSGPLWYRGYALEPESTICDVLDDALEKMEARRMVIGHTPQRDGRVLSRCHGKVFVIDVGISSVYGGHTAALEIVGDRVRALYPKNKVVELG
ncbi:hypothetical protein HK104_006349 [Borealophlyctis nickersoniae]|nr:hypothetical protein HK104_006349 [Borealophlyctis nickersoniae]